MITGIPKDLKVTLAQHHLDVLLSELQVKEQV
jgi:hypothetical protein